MPLFLPIRRGPPGGLDLMSLPTILKWSRRRALALALSAGAIASLEAHPGSWHTIELISAQIESGDHRAALYYARGLEYRSVERWTEAEMDLRTCLRADPGFFPAQKELGPVLLAAGRRQDALSAAQQAIKLAAGRPAATQASAWVELARIRKAAGEWPEVLYSTGEALKLVPGGEVDWYLLRAEAYRAQGNVGEAIDELARGEAGLRSSLLRTAWLEALLEAGRAEETLAPIDSAMAETRHQAPWLVRRARARTQLGQIGAARSDWESALNEISERLVPGDPDPSLLVLRGLALSGLGRQEEASRALESARAIAADPALVAPLARELNRPAVH